MAIQIQGGHNPLALHQLLQPFTQLAHDSHADLRPFSQQALETQAVNAKYTHITNSKDRSDTRAAADDGHLTHNITC